MAASKTLLTLPTAFKSEHLLIVEVCLWRSLTNPCCIHHELMSESYFSKSRSTDRSCGSFVPLLKVVTAWSKVHVEAEVEGKVEGMEWW